MPKFSVFARVELRNEAGRLLTTEDWNDEHDTYSPYADSLWAEVTDALEDVFQKHRDRQQASEEQKK